MASSFFFGCLVGAVLTGLLFNGKDDKG